MRRSFLKLMFMFFLTLVIDVFLFFWRKIVGYNLLPGSLE